jgi:hypothetical protein
MHVDLHVKCLPRADDFNQNVTVPTNLVKLPTTNFYEKPFNALRAVTC